MHDTKNPPGQWRPPKYLRDEIKRIQEEFKVEEATLPSTDAEKRLERLKTALLKLCEGRELNANHEWRVPQMTTSEIRRIIEENA